MLNSIASQAPFQSDSPKPMWSRPVLTLMAIDEITMNGGDGIGEASMFEHS